MNTIRVCSLAAFASLLLLVCGTPANAASDAAAAQKPVQVTYANPKSFTENRIYGHEDRFNDLNYLDRLKTFIIKRATPLLATGQQLHITITDIRLAGAYEPWLGPYWDHVRIMRDSYPPRIDLKFKWIGKDGAVLRQGTRKLVNMDYLQSGMERPGDDDPLRYDKALISHWLRRGLTNL